MALGAKQDSAEKASPRLEALRLLSFDSPPRAHATALL